MESRPAHRTIVRRAFGWRNNIHLAADAREDHPGRLGKAISTHGNCRIVKTGCMERVYALRHLPTLVDGP